ncbi:MAG: chemotaxis protein CheC [Clostridia bacterium]
MDFYDSLDATKLDALKEIGNIGSGNAATALSEMLEEPVDIGIPVVTILDYNQVVDSLGGSENVLISLMLTLDGDVNGMILFLLEHDFAHKLLNELTGSDFDKIEEIDDLSKSAILEVGNIMASSYVNAIASLTGLDIAVSVPNISVDMVGSILSVPAIFFANISDKIIFIEDKFDDDTKRSSSRILMIPEVDSLKKIMESLGI